MKKFSSETEKTNQSVKNEETNTTSKPNNYSKRSFYLRKKKNSETAKVDNEPKKEEKKIEVKKIIKKIKVNKPYIHHSQPKLKIINLNIDNDIKEEIKKNLKKDFSSKTMLNIEQVQNKLLTENTKENDKNKKLINDKLHKSNSLNKIKIKISVDKIDNPNKDNNEISVNNTTANNNEKKILVNLKQNDNINSISNPEIKNDKKNLRDKYKSLNNTMHKPNINININLPQKDAVKTNSKTTTNINVVSSQTNVTKTIVQVSKNKTQSKMDLLKSQGKSLLLGAPKKECPVCHKFVETHLLLIHINIHTTQIYKWLYLGSFENACDIKELRRNKINYVLNCAQECKNLTLPKSINQLHLNIRDEPEFNIKKFFDQTNDYINKVRNEGGNILVHCKVGRSRSVSCIIAYLVKYFGYNVDSAIKFIKKKRPQIMPNQGFIQQLHEYESSFKKKGKK